MTVLCNQLSCAYLERLFETRGVQNSSLNIDPILMLGRWISGGSTCLNFVLHMDAECFAEVRRI